MILVDTSVWIDHLRSGVHSLQELLNNQEVLTHPFVIGELSLGTLRNRDEILSLLSKLPAAPLAEHEEVMSIVSAHRLSGTGIGWIDAHLLASALLGNAKILTRDKQLQKATILLGVAPS